jgi:hypothetical protein
MKKSRTQQSRNKVIDYPINGTDGASEGDSTQTIYPEAVKAAIYPISSLKFSVVNTSLYFDLISFIKRERFVK